MVEYKSTMPDATEARTESSPPSGRPLPGVSAGPVAPGISFISADFDAHTCTVRYAGAIHVLTLDYDPGEGGRPYCWGGDEDACLAANDDQQVVNALADAWKYGDREVA